VTIGAGNPRAGETLAGPRCSSHTTRSAPNLPLPKVVETAAAEIELLLATATLAAHQRFEHD
jgi:hypothetical protein